MKTQFDITKTIIGTPAKDMGLTQREKNLFVYLSNFFGLDNGQWKCYPSLATLSELSGIKRSDISSITNKLVNLGFISKESRYDNSVIYTFESLVIETKPEVLVVVEAPVVESKPLSTEPEQSNVEPENVEPEAIQEASEPIIVKVINHNYKAWVETQEEVDYAAIAQSRLEDRYQKGRASSYKPQPVSSFSDNLPF